MLPNFSYPVYTVVCPQSKYTYDVRCLVVGDEDRLLQSSTFAYSVLDNINKVIWSCIVNKPDNITDFNAFLANTTQKDRDAFVYSILQASDEDKQVIDVTCAYCGTKQTVEISLESCFNANIYPGEPGEMINNVVDINVELKNHIVNAKLKVPTLAREKEIFYHFGQRNLPLHVLTLLLHISELNIIDKKTDKPIQEAKILPDIEATLVPLPHKVRRKLTKAISDNFAQYGMNLQYKFFCSKPDCGKENIHELDVTDLLFRTIV